MRSSDLTLPLGGCCPSMLSTNWDAWVETWFDGASSGRTSVNSDCRGGSSRNDLYSFRFALIGSIIIK